MKIDKILMIILFAYLPTVYSQPKNVFTFTGGLGVGTQGDITLGYEFNIIEPVIITELGIADPTPSTPLQQDHDVGLWNSAGVLVARVKVLTNSPIRGNGRFELIDPIFAVGSGYKIGAIYNTTDHPTPDFPFASTISHSNSPSIEFVQSWQSGGGPLSIPDIQLPDIFNDGVFGPLFNILQTQDPAMEATQGQLVYSATENMVGWDFNVTQTIMINELGFYDSSPNTPLEQDHLVRIWNEEGNIIASIDVKKNAPLKGNFRYSAILPWLLHPGTYTIGAKVGEFDLDDDLRVVSDIKAPDGVEYVRAVQSFNSDPLIRPTSQLIGGDGGIFGPTFSISANTMSSVNIDPDGPGPYLNAQINRYFGWEFDVTSGILITELGIFDETPDTPLNKPHDIFVFSPECTFITGAIVDASAPILGNFRYTSLVIPYYLKPGNGYKIVANYDGSVLPEDTPISYENTIMNIENVVIKRNIRNATPEISCPDILVDNSTNGLFGPGFKVATFDRDVIFENEFEIQDFQ